MSFVSAGVQSPGTKAFIHTAYEAFQQTRQTVGLPIERYFNVAGFVVRLQFAGTELLSVIVPALVHLEVKPCQNPALTICIWDSVSTGTMMPAPLWAPEDYAARGEVRGQSDARYHTAYVRHSGLLSLIDLEQNLAIYWVRDASELPSYETSAPLRTTLNWWLSKRNCQLVHAAAVGTAEGGVLMVGKSGSGKSNTALTCLLSPLQIASDDFCIVTADETPTVYTLYNTAKTHAVDLPRVPFLQHHVSNPDQLNHDKAIYFLYQSFPEKLIASFPLRAILIPRVTGQSNTFLTQATPGAVLMALAPTTLLLLPDARSEALKAMGTITKQMPCYYLELGTETSQIPGVIASLLA
ncbi:hypothetical protein IAD21_00049 [Abditibacteriota bacterium]|nr:hypothetical protein IAD21_00049 [Abditibacteriota bacterium]